MTPEQTKRFKYWQTRTIIATMVGYALFYFVRKNFSLAMPGLEADLGISKTSLGIFLTLNGVVYGLSRFVNGILADRMNARWYMAIGKLTRQLDDTARRSPQRVVFAEGIHPNMLKAAVEAKAEGICHPILLGNDEAIGKLAEEMDLSLEGIEIVNLRHPDESERRERYSRILAEKRAREGFTYEEANDKMFERNYFGMMMVETGDADAFITGLYTRYSNTIKVAKEVIGIQPGFKHFGTMHILNSKKGTYFLADTLINRHPDTETLIDIAKLSDKTVRFFNHTPVISMLSYSNFGADTAGSPVKVHEAVAHMQEEYPELAIDGEMQVNFAMNRELRDTKYPFTRLKGKDVNTLIFPNLSSANAGYKLLQAMDPDTEFIGPIQMGLNKPIHFTDFESSVRDIVNITAVAVIDAIVDKKKRGGK